MTIDTEKGMRVIKASEFKAKCLKLMEEVAQTGEPLVITKNGKPIAQLHKPGAKEHLGSALRAD